MITSWRHFDPKKFKCRLANGSFAVLTQKSMRHRDGERQFAHELAIDSTTIASSDYIVHTGSSTEVANLFANGVGYEVSEVGVLKQVNNKTERIKNDNA
jgi:hypothetical protein